MINNQQETQDYIFGKGYSRKYKLTVLIVCIGTLILAYLIIRYAAKDIWRQYPDEVIENYEYGIDSNPT